MLSSGSFHRWCDLSERSSVDQAVTGTGQDRTGTGIYSAVVRATGRAVVLESLAHLVSKDEVVSH